MTDIIYIPLIQYRVFKIENQQLSISHDLPSVSFTFILNLYQCLTNPANYS